jgi:hypothetical protein
VADREQQADYCAIASPAKREREWADRLIFAATSGENLLMPPHYSTRRAESGMMASSALLWLPWRPALLD